MFPPCSSIPPKILKNIFQKNSHRYLKTFRLWNLANKYTAKESIWYGRRFLELRPSVSFYVEIYPRQSFSMKNLPSRRIRKGKKGKCAAFRFCNIWIVHPFQTRHKKKCALLRYQGCLISNILGQANGNVCFMMCNCKWCEN